MKFGRHTWRDAKTIRGTDFTCANCMKHVSTNQGWNGSRKPPPGESGNEVEILLAICSKCGYPTYLSVEGNDQYPGAPHGDQVDHVTDNLVRTLFDEARECYSAGAYTAAVLACRKLLMHIAVDKGAKENQTFANYVKHLKEGHYFPPDSEVWVEEIRKRGNEANHEIVLMSADDARELIDFISMLLKQIYEFPHRARNRRKPEAQILDGAS